MTEPWHYQLRVYLTENLAALARAGAPAPALKPLTDILDRHQAALVSQFDAFEAYVAEAELHGPENYPLYKWTKATIEDPAKRAKHGTTFAIHVANHEVYPQAAADALEADLHPLVGGPLVERMSKHDTNPANNLQVPKQYQ
jgi:hypothetical protein